MYSGIRGKIRKAPIYRRKRRKIRKPSLIVHRINKIQTLPQDIIFDILLRLPYQSIIYCKLVCKPWRDLLSNTKLDILFLVGTERYIRKNRQLYHGGQQYDNIDVHGCYSYKKLAKFDNHSTPPGSWPQMVGSCNGLVCFSDDHDCIVYDPIHICNPITGEYVNLPKYIMVDEDKHTSYCSFIHDFISGFGYNYLTDEYKVVRMYCGCNPLSGLILKVQVYTLGSGLGWRDKGKADFSICRTERSICANGALHWIEWKKRKIVAFDLADEKFILISLPSVYSFKSEGLLTLTLLRGYLSVFQEAGNYVNIWSLKKKKKCNSYYMGEDEFDNYWGWNKEFRIPWDATKADDCRSLFDSYHPFAVTKSNQVLLWFRGVLFCYDSKATTLTKLWDIDPLRLWVEAFPHLNSLVSLQALGEKSIKRT